MGIKLKYVFNIHTDKEKKIVLKKRNFLTIFSKESFLFKKSLIHL